MRLNYIKGQGDPHRANMYVEGEPVRRVSVSGHDVHATARSIAFRVNTHDAMVQVLRMFSSKEMGSKLVDVVVDSYEDEGKAAVVEQRLRALVNAVDVILKGIELHEQGG
jgi:hypothetical protein